MLSHVQLCVTPWTVAHQAPLAMEFSRQEYWSGLPFPSPGDLPNPGTDPASPALADGFPLHHLGSATQVHTAIKWWHFDLHPGSETCSVVSDSLWAHGLYSPWNSLGHNTGVGSRSLLQGIFPTEGPNLGLLHWRQILYQLSSQGSPDR